MPLNAVFQNGPELGQGRVHPDGLGHRRPADARPRLADADGVPRRRARHLAAVVERPAWRSSPSAPTGGYARVRTQFKTPIGKFEGIEEALTRMGGNLYMMDADARADRGRDRPGREAGGACPASPSYHITERGRAGRQRRDGRRRRQGHLHGAVELPRRRVHAAAGGDHRRGRQHPHPQPDHLRPGRDPLPSVRAEGDARRRARRTAPRRRPTFDAALFGHIRFTLSNMARTLVMGLTGSHFVARAGATSRRRRAATTSS